MLNEDLLDPKDQEIARLRIIIEQFKKYDLERKKYYSEALIRLGQLEDYIEELEAESNVSDLRKKIKNQSAEISRLNHIINFNNHFKDLAELELNFEKLYESNRNLRLRVENLEKKNKSLTETRDKLLLEIAKKGLLLHNPQT